jgi:6-phosphogluconate dehydrogenase
MQQTDIGLIGMAVMGQNLALNMADHGFAVSVFNRTYEKTEAFVQGEAKGRTIEGFESLEAFVASVKRPRKVMMMVKAGAPVDVVIDELLPLLEPGDVIIDGGNSHYTDTTRRTRDLDAKGILFVGTGISGGEDGARHGPSIMPGGNPKAWEEVRPVLQAISAKVDGEPCCDWVGNDGAGHYVKMVHNGIEYGDMELIAEAYQMMRTGLGMDLSACHDVFAAWNKGVLDSYLIEITADILTFTDKDGAPLVDKILDAAAQKGTGKWTGMSALEMGMPLSLITEAVYARCLSALKDERVAASKRFEPPRNAVAADPGTMIAAVHDALYASKIISYAQGYMLMREASEQFGWKLNYGGIALMWRGGCIIRSRFLGDIRRAYDTTPGLTNLLMNDFFAGEIRRCEPLWRKTVGYAVTSGIPAPAMSSALAFFDGYRSERVSANMIQAQRDYFGAHTYERVDAPRGRKFHTDWIHGERVADAAKDEV